MSHCINVHIDRMYQLRLFIQGMKNLAGNHISREKRPVLFVFFSYGQDTGCLLWIQAILPYSE